MKDVTLEQIDKLLNQIERKKDMLNRIQFRYYGGENGEFWDKDFRKTVESFDTKEELTAIFKKYE